MSRRVFACLAVIAAVVLLTAGAATGQVEPAPYPEEPPPTVLTEEVTRPSTAPSDPATPPTRRPASTGRLPVTGGDIAGLAAIGAGAILVGAALVRRRGSG